MTAAIGRKIDLEKLNILVFGAGAIGTYIGGSLALAGHHVVFLERPAQVEELQARGLRLELKKAEGRRQEAEGRKQKAEGPAFAIAPSAFGCASSLQEALGLGSFDVAIFALKSFDTAAALEGMKPFIEQIPPILCLSNGVENEAALAEVLGADRVIAGTVTSSVARRAVGDIVLEKLRGIGVADGHPLSLCLWEALNGAALNARVYPRAADMKWSKMITNLMVNATVAILDMSPYAVLSNPELFRLEIAMLREALAVMKAQGIRVVDIPGTPVRLLALATRLPAFISRPLMVRAVGGGRGGKMPSFHIDLYAGRGKSEVEWLNGAVVRFGEKFGVSVPVNKQLCRILVALTQNEIPLAEFRGQPGKLLDRIKENS
jgi:2-dehydropantoate 2-reductase